MTSRPRVIGGISILVGCLVAISGCSSPALALHTSTASPSKAAPVVVAIGDSIMKGNGLSPDQAWPELIATANGWNLTNLSCNGAGFKKTGDATDCNTDFSGLVARAVALGPSLILISGSSNDLGIDNGQLEVQTRTVIDALHAALPSAHIVGISAVWNDSATPSQINDINDQMRSAIQDVNGTYLDIGQPLASHRDLLQSDDVHPTGDGQIALATAIAAALKAAGIQP